MERMEVDSSDDLSKVRTFGAINFKAGGEEVPEYSGCGRLARLRN